MADSLGAFGVAEEAARGIRQAMADTNSSIPLGPSIEKGDFQQMGMRAFKGGRIDRGDRIAANMRFVPGASFLGNLFGMNVGKSRYMENIARQSYFQARPSVDAMMQNMPVSALGVGAPLEEFTDEMLATLDSINILGETINLGSFDRGKHIFCLLYTSDAADE